MDCLLTEREIMIVGGLAFFFILLSLWMVHGDVRRTDLPNGFKRAGLAWQLAGTADRLRRVIGFPKSDYRATLRRSIRKDFIYVFAYVILFVSLSVMLSQAGIPTAKWLGPIAAISIIGAALFDLIENSRMLRAISVNPENVNDAMAVRIRQASLLKWGLFFVAIGLLGLILLLRLDFLSGIGVFFLLSALVGITGLRYHQMIPLAIPLLGVGAVGTAVLLIAWPEAVLRSLCS